jgi:hypothetical protein
MHTVLFGGTFQEALQRYRSVIMLFAATLALTIPVMAWVNKSGEESVPFDDRDTFLTDLNAKARKFGLFPGRQAGTALTYRAAFPARLMIDPILVEIEDGVATLSGPALTVKQFVKRLKADG